MGNACVTDGCLNAVWELTSSIDLTVEPCKNFYGFACGLWGNESSSPIARHGKRHDSYMSIQRGAYVTAVNLSLLQPPRGPSVTWMTTASNMSVVYRSCLRFFGEEPVDFYETMRASGIDFNAWTSVSTFDDLFALAIGHALQYNMTSVLGVRWRDDRGGSEFLDIFTGMSIVQRMGSSSRRRFVIRGLMLIGQYNTLGQIAAVENLDNAITEKVTTPCSSSTPKTEISLTEMDTPRTNWSRAVAEYAELVGRQPPSEALVENISGVRAVLEQLAKAERLSVAVYLMLSPLAEFFLIEDEVQRQEPVNIDGGERPAMYEACVRTLELLFGEHYRRWVSMHIHKQGITSDVRRLWKVVLAALERFALDRPSTPLDWETVYAVSELETALPDTERRTPHDQIEGTALPSEYSRDFISNIIRFSQKTGAKRRCEPFLTLYSIGMRWSDRETLLRLLVPDFYHPEVTEHVINYATLGYFLAELAIRSALPKNWSSKGYFLCMENYARFHLGLVSSKWHWRQLRERIWAAQVALRAAVMESADLSTRDDLLRLFFLRLARTSCSLAARRRDDAGHISEVATSCNMIAMTAPNFSRAFGCPNLPDVDC
ncbi:hypothetical protein V5799_009027 [Amblyomma americanum]|uniref:Uncharacterized protein n=1 Tax=Amblyomma americanum TaxID=6943 RepID=A0AAQ4FBH5_AMBAM